MLRNQADVGGIGERHAALAVETARRLCCDAGIVAAVDGPAGEPLAVGRNEALGLAIDGRTATARRDGVPVDYDQGVMVAMASWGPCGTGSEAAATPEHASPP